MSNMVVNTNVLALNSHRNIGKVGKRQATSSSRLSSGLRVNSAADDAAGLAISEKMRAQIRGLDQASTNAQDAQSLVQTAEGGLQEIDNMVQRIRELVVQVSNDTNEQNMTENIDQGDRQKIQEEIDQLVEEIDSMTERVEFNNKKLLNGDYGIEHLDADKTIITNAKKAVTDKLGEITDKEGEITTEEGKITAAYTALKSELGTKYGTIKAELDTALQEAKDLVIDEDASPAAGTIDSEANKKAMIKEIEDAGVILEKVKALSEQDEIDETVLDGLVQDITGLTIDISNVEDNASSPSSIAGIEALTAAFGNFAIDKGSNFTDITAAEGVISTKKDELTGLNDEMPSLQDAVDKAVKEADKNGTEGLYFQIGANANQSIEFSINSVNSEDLGIGFGDGRSDMNVVKASGRDITEHLNTLDKAVSYVTRERSRLGAVENRLEYTQNSLDISSENLSAAESRIRKLKIKN